METEHKNSGPPDSVQQHRSEFSIQELCRFNLKIPSLTVPYRGLTAVGGAPGAGRRALVFGTIHAEWRRYLAALGEGDFLGSVGDSPNIVGLRPVVSLGSAAGGLSRVSETDSGRSDRLIDLLGIKHTFDALFSVASCFCCDRCGAEVVRSDPDRELDSAIHDVSGGRVLVGASLSATELIEACGCDRRDASQQAVSAELFAALLERFHVRRVVFEGVVYRVAELFSSGADWKGSDNKLCRALSNLSEYDPKQLLFGLILDTLALEESRRARVREVMSKVVRAGWAVGVIYSEKSGEDKLCRHYLSDAPICSSCETVVDTPPILKGFTREELEELKLSELEKVLNQLTSDNSGPGISLTRVQLVLKAAALVGCANELCLRSPASSLSTGELVKARLLAALGAELTETLYVLEELSAVLHPVDFQAVLPLLRSLVEKGNGALVIEGRSRFFRYYDHLILLGPGSGKKGGRVVFSGKPADLKDRESARSKFSTAGLKNRSILFEHWIEELGVRIPVGAVTAVVGRSGSGKSRFFRSLESNIASRKPRKGRPSEDGFFRVESVNLSLGQLERTYPSGRLGSRFPLTIGAVLGIDRPIAEVYAKQKAATRLSLDWTQFRVGRDGGQCTRCGGWGEVRVDLGRFGVEYEQCNHCLGERFSPSVLHVDLEGRSIAELYRLELKELSELFLRGGSVAHGAIQSIIRAALELGLGHLCLGYELTRCDRHAQARVQLAALSQDLTSRTLFLLDQPFAGLDGDQDADCWIESGIAFLRRLTESGSTVLFSTHDQLAVALADYCVEFAKGDGKSMGVGRELEAWCPSVGWAGVACEYPSGHKFG